VSICMDGCVIGCVIGCVDGILVVRRHIRSSGLPAASLDLSGMR